MLVLDGREIGIHGRRELRVNLRGRVILVHGVQIRLELDSGHPVEADGPLGLDCGSFDWCSGGIGHLLLLVVVRQSR
jgi:hypothetical protein